MKYNLLISLTISTLLSNCAGKRPNFVNKVDTLAPCPKTLNCVLTLSNDNQHKIEPIAYTTSKKEAMEKLVKIINSMERTKIITQTENYLYAEFTSKIWKFVDDVEFIFDDSAKVINFRSASRLGKSDLGVNRKRMEEIRTLFNN